MAATALDREECLRLLATEDVGRLAIVQGHVPAIFPVTYALDGADVVVRTDPGTKLDHGPGALAAFEIDGLDREARTGWSVVVTGRLEAVADGDPGLSRLRRLGLRPWAGGAKDHWLRLPATLVSGRRVTPD